MIKLKSLLKENTSNSLIEQVKHHLYEYGDYLSWKEFVDHQENGDCQNIVSAIIRTFPQFKGMFGEIERDTPYMDEYGKEQILQTHHWVSINGINLDFSKGTLKDGIQFDNIYDVYIIGDEWRYNR